MRTSRPAAGNLSESWPERRAEVKLVKLLCRTPLPGETLCSIRRLIECPLDWEYLLHIASDLDVEALVLSNLRTHFLDSIPPAFQSQIMTREREVRAFAIRSSMLTVGATQLLESAGIPSIVMKGPAIGVVAYDDVSLRSSSDIDLLVKREHIELARDVLLNGGYSRDYAPEDEKRLVRDTHALEFSSARAKLEIHHALLSKHLRFSIPERMLWGTARQIECAGHEIWVLSKPVLLVFLCAHGTKHQWSNFKWIVDVAQLVARMSQSEVEEAVRIASKASARRILALGLRAARDVLGQDISRFPAQTLVPESVTAGMVHRLDPFSAGISLPPNYERLAAIHPAIPALASWAQARERVSDRAYGFVRLAVFPSPGGRTSRWAWIRRAARLILRYFRRASS